MTGTTGSTANPTAATSSNRIPSSSSWSRKAIVAAVLSSFLLATLKSSIQDTTSSLKAFTNQNARSVLAKDGVTMSLRKSALAKKSKTDEYKEYIPSKMEDYILTHMKELKLDAKAPNLVTTCHLWKDPLSSPIYDDLHTFRKDLEDYYKRVEAFQLDHNITDIREHLKHRDNDNDNKEKAAAAKSEFCTHLEVAQDGLPSIFAKEQLSYTRAGWVEPLLPPMRHPNWCIDGTQTSLGSIDYLIHDFAHTCRQLKPTSRLVLFDMGASLMFSKKWPSPVLKLVDNFRKFGLPFDHIYAYEVTQQQPADVFIMLPLHMRAAFHWINVGVDSDPKSENNPFKLLLDNYHEDDLIIVKLDIDSSGIERTLANQLLGDERLLMLIDHFYFEHHVNQAELAPYWGHMQETVEESLTLFQELRKKGVASHYWN